VFGEWYEERTFAMTMMGVVWQKVIDTWSLSWWTYIMTRGSVRMRRCLWKWLMTMFGVCMKWYRTKDGKRGVVYIQQPTRERDWSYSYNLSDMFLCSHLHCYTFTHEVLFFFICDSWYKWMLYQCPCIITWLTNSPSFDHSSVPPMDSKHHSLLFIINSNFSFRRCVCVLCCLSAWQERSGQKEKVVLMMVTL